VRKLQYFKKEIFFAHENIEKLPSKVAYNKPIFTVMPTGQKPAQISISIP
jgi:hypothetical protein